MRSAPAVPPSLMLTDGVVGVRLRQDSDSGAIIAASHDPSTQRWLTDEPLGPDAAVGSVERAKAAWASGAATPMVIVDAADNTAAGLINLRFHSDLEATLAYSVFPERRGQGFAPRAVRLVTTWAQFKLGLQRVILEAEWGNTASIRVAEKSGFRRLADRREDNRVFAVFVADAAAG